MEKLLALTVRKRVDTAQTHRHPTSIGQTKDLFPGKNSPPSAGEKGHPGATLPAVEFDRKEKTIASAGRTGVDLDKTAPGKDFHRVAPG